MAQEPRRHRRNYNVPGHAHELTFSCYRRYAFLRAGRTCQWLAEAIDDARQALAFDLWAYVFMPDHVPLIVWPRTAVYVCRRYSQRLGGTGGNSWACRVPLARPVGTGTD